MPRSLTFALFFAAVFLQAGAYGLTFMLPRLFDTFGADEQTVGTMLILTTAATLITVSASGHISDVLGRQRSLSAGCVAISAGLFLFSIAESVGAALAAASVLLGFGWGLTYTLGPVVLTRIVADDERVTYFTLLSVMVMTGIGVSPVLAAALDGLGYSVRAAFTVTAAACLASAALFILLDRPIRKAAISAAPELPSRLSLSALKAVSVSHALVPIGMVCIGAAIYAGLNNFQTVFADARGLEYSQFFIAYTATVVVFRLVLARFKGGPNPYRTIALLQTAMVASILVFMVGGSNVPAYIAFSVLFGLGYGVSYPLLVSMAARDADPRFAAQTLQLFALTYFIGIFGFPLVAGWMIVQVGTFELLVLLAAMAVLETSMAARRALRPSPADRPTSPS